MDSQQKEIQNKSMSNDLDVQKSLKFDDEIDQKEKSNKSLDSILSNIQRCDQEYINHLSSQILNFLDLNLPSNFSQLEQKKNQKFLQAKWLSQDFIQLIENFQLKIYKFEVNKQLVYVNDDLEFQEDKITNQDDISEDITNNDIFKNGLKNIHSFHFFLSKTNILNFLEIFQHILDKCFKEGQDSVEQINQQWLISNLLQAQKIKINRMDQQYTQQITQPTLCVIQLGEFKNPSEFILTCKFEQQFNITLDNDSIVLKSSQNELLLVFSLQNAKQTFYFSKNNNNKISIYIPVKNNPEITGRMFNQTKLENCSVLQIQISYKQLQNIFYQISKAKNIKPEVIITNIKEIQEKIEDLGQIYSQKMQQCIKNNEFLYDCFWYLKVIETNRIVNFDMQGYDAIYQDLYQKSKNQLRYEFKIEAYAMELLFANLNNNQNYYFYNIDKIYRNILNQLQQLHEDQQDQASDKKQKDQIIQNQISIKDTKQQIQIQKLLKSGKYVVLKKLRITPTGRVIYLPYQVNEKNRFYRIIKKDQNKKILLVQFRNDNGIKIQFLQQTYDYDYVVRFYKNILMDGLVLFQQKFQFFGASSSSLREQQIIFYKSEEKNEIYQLREMIMPIQTNEQIDTPLLYISRIGLFFTNDFEFAKLQNNQYIIVEDIYAKNNEILTDGCGKDGKHAINYLKDYFSGIALEELQKYSLVQDPYFFSLLRNIFKSKLKKMKQKYSIFIKKSCKLIGVSDPLGILKDNEIFVQIPEEQKKQKNNNNIVQAQKFKVIEGQVIVYKNPLSRPSHVQKVKAVNYQQLQFLQNVVVFPCGSHIQQSLVKKLSNGDLDGDTFSVIWDENLVPDSSIIQYPQDVPDPQINNFQKPENNKFNSQSILSSAISTSIFSYLLGPLNQLFLNITDMSKIGVADEQAQYVSKLHDLEIDYLKKGKRAEKLEEQLNEFNQNVTENTYPYYMEKNDYIKRKSNKILAQLYTNYQNILKENVFDKKLEINVNSIQQLQQMSENIIENEHQNELFKKILKEDFETQCMTSYYIICYNRSFQFMIDTLKNDQQNTLEYQLNDLASYIYLSKQKELEEILKHKTGVQEIEIQYHPKQLDILVVQAKGTHQMLYELNFELEQINQYNTKMLPNHSLNLTSYHSDQANTTFSKHNINVSGKNTIQVYNGSYIKEHNLPIKNKVIFEQQQYFQNTENIEQFVVEFDKMIQVQQYYSLFQNAVQIILKKFKQLIQNNDIDQNKIEYLKGKIIFGQFYLTNVQDFSTFQDQNYLTLEDIDKGLNSKKTKRIFSSQQNFSKPKKKYQEKNLEKQIEQGKNKVFSKQNRINYQQGSKYNQKQKRVNFLSNGFSQALIINNKFTKQNVSEFENLYRIILDRCGLVRKEEQEKQSTVMRISLLDLVDYESILEKQLGISQDRIKNCGKYKNMVLNNDYRFGITTAQKINKDSNYLYHDIFNKIYPHGTNESPLMKQDNQSECPIKKPHTQYYLYEQSFDFIILTENKENYYLKSNPDITAQISTEQYSQNSEEIKIVTKPVPFLKDYEISDISINAGGNDEDKIYCYNQDYRLNIRRGNSIITRLDKNGNPVEDIWARKGLPKFFDLAREYIEYNLGEVSELTTFGIKNQTEHIQLHKIIFERAQKSLEKGHQVQLLKMNKANGENCQISYFAEQNCWVIASKNVSMLCQYKRDIYIYKGDRYQYAQLIAETWFNILNKIGRKQAEQLKEYLDNMTLVGEYVGNQNHQHLVKYEQINLNFFALIDNETDLVCLPPLDIIKIFQGITLINDKNFMSRNQQKFFLDLGLSFVKHQDLGIFDSWKELNQGLKNAFDATAEASIEEEEEGSVLYLIQKNKDANIDDKVLSLCKLKTLEYRFYRKLREKLRNFINFKNKKNSKSKEELILKFKAECIDLLQNNKSSRPIEYYLKVAQVAFDFVENYYSDSDLVHEQYITFLSTLHYCIDTNQEFTPEFLLDEKLKQQLLSIPWSKYSTEKVLQNYQEIQSKQFVANVKEKKKLYFFIPISVPGMGKTTLCDILRQNIEKVDKDSSLLVISSDLIRKQLIDNKKQKKPFLNEDQLFEQTKSQYNKEYFKTLKEIIQQKSQQEQSNNIFIFLDKNHPPNGIEKAINDIKNVIPINYDHEIIGLVPKVDDGKQFAQNDLVFPFSLSFMFNCLNRVQKRTQHPTLPGSGIKSGNIMIMFLNMFRNVTLSDSLCKKGGLDRIERFYFHQESEDLIKNKNLVDLFQSVLNQTIPGQICKNKRLLDQFIIQFEKEDFNFPQISFDEIQKQAHQLIKDILGNQEQTQDTKEIQDKQNTQQNEDQIIKDIVYQGIFAQNEEQARQCVLQYTKDAFQNICQIFLSKNSKNELIQEDLQLFQTKQQKQKEELNLYQLFNVNAKENKDFSVIDNLHVTSLFIGGKKKDKFSQQEIQIYEQFKEGRNHDINLQVLAYVPNKLICALADVTPQMLINNEYAHVTIATNGWPAKMSNDILKKVFSLQNMDKTLAEIKKGNLINQVHQDAFEYKGQMYDIYLIKPAGNYIIEGVTKNFTNQMQKDSQVQKQKQKQEIIALRHKILGSQDQNQQSKEEKELYKKNQKNTLQESKKQNQLYKPKQEQQQNKTQYVPKKEQQDISQDNQTHQQIYKQEKEIQVQKNTKEQQEIRNQEGVSLSINKRNQQKTYKHYKNQQEEDHYYFENRQYKQKRRF
ncbi:hypothetical protein PPERSA_02873 [Pseudocohnilembus persalinus]|uniref:RDRP core domain-containing protein n=1 Tax=Pseudocohnilembus persalinus TaxID=266149 RepID=A0A0V0QMN0_PSEPJ|nr:hypothetical protein PPERSA_02873 [Pseudocohnilembus persalinus]|eukprot:KRX03494.1 hypothetical protein PPERSA_02873 [Pseudocohnilembus persalinus]